MRLVAIALSSVATAAVCGCGSANPNGWGHAPPKRAPALVRPELAVIRATPKGSDSEQELVVMTRQGRVIRVLAGGRRRGIGRPTFDGTASWSPDGRRIAFAGESGSAFTGPGATPAPTDIYSVDAEGRTPRRLTHAGDASNPVWTPDGRGVLFVRRVGRDYPWRFALWLVDANGGHARVVVPETKGRVVYGGSPHPGGSSIAVTVANLVPPDHNGRLRDRAAVYSLSVDATLSKIIDDASAPAYSPDGRRLAFVSERARNGDVQAGEDEVAYASELYLADADGGNVSRLTRTRNLSEGSPHWSPDGAVIAYTVVDSNYTTHVLLVNADGSCTTPLTFDEQSETSYNSPAWRPGLPRRGGGPLRC